MNNYLKAVCLLLYFFMPGLYAQSVQQSNPDESFRITFSERFRLETWDNAVTLSKDAKAGNSYARFKTTLMLQWFPGKSSEIGIRLAHEFKNYLAPSTNNFHLNEVFFDQLYYKQNINFLTGTQITLGRQNISYGEGFLVSEGTPLDGSRSAYFNAVKVDLTKDKSKFSLFWAYQPKTDKFAVINGNDIDPANCTNGTFTLGEQDVTSGGIYFENQLSGLNLQAYFLRKDYVNPDEKLKQITSGFNTAGARINLSVSRNFNAVMEGAYQFGRMNNASQKSFGYYGYADFSPEIQKPYVPKTFTAGLFWLSGDDKSTEAEESWDPVFSRWPKWSDLLVYTFIKESRVAYWSNIASFYASMKFAINPQVLFSLTYHHLIAPQLSLKSEFLSGTGKTRGDLMSGKLSFDISENVSGHLLWEHFIPGNYYSAGSDASNWARIEFTLKY